MTGLRPSDMQTINRQLTHIPIEATIVYAIEHAHRSARRQIRVIIIVHANRDHQVFTDGGLFTEVDMKRQITTEMRKPMIAIHPDIRCVHGAFKDKRVQSVKVIPD